MQTGGPAQNRAGGIAARIRRLVLGVTAVALLFAALTHAVIEYHYNREALVENLQTLGAMIAEESAAAIMSDDQDGALQALNRLKAKQDLLKAEIYLPDGQPFAAVGQDQTGAPSDEDRNWRQVALRDRSGTTSHRFDGDDADVLLPIRHADRIIAFLHLESGLGNLRQEMASFFAAVIALFALLMGGVYLITNRLQRRITAPIRDLARAMREVSDHENYALRLRVESADEIGDLITGFNRMLGQIELRDQAIAHTRQDLENKVAERTTELEAARQQAEAGSRAKSDFLAVMSHEIRTPMNGVLGMTELLLGSGLTPRQKRLAETAHRSARGLLDVINNILDFSKIEAGHLELALEATELRPLFDDILDMFADEARNKGIEIHGELPPDLPRRVHCDATRLRQVLINLVGNAVKFTEHGEVRLSVAPAHETDGSVRLDIVISDTGPGIPPAQQGNIFEAFAQGDTSSARRFSGTGLGLAITRRLVQLMDGTIGLDSEVGRGSRFALSVRVQPIAETEGVPMGLLGGLRVLLVDGDANHRDLLGRQLAAWGMRHDCALDTAEALALLRMAAAEDDPYLITLFDWQAPPSDGATLARAIAEDRLIPELAMIVIVADDGDIVQQIPDLPVAGYLTRPIRQDRLLDRLLASQRGRIPGVSAAPRHVPAARDFRGVRVLLAEDNRVNQEVALGMLEQLGCRVDVVENGRDAIEAFRRQGWQLVLMDCHMPEVDGFEATAAIRSMEQELQRARTPVIALTADIQRGIAEQCRNAGMDEYLCKPLDQEGLARTLRKWLPEPVETPADSYPAQPAASSAALDTATLATLRRIGESSGRRLLENAARLFCRDTPLLLEAMRDGVARDDAAAVHQAAHALKSASAQLGALGLSARCGELEAAARDGGAGHLEGLFATLEVSATEALSAVAMLNEVSEGSPETSVGEPPPVDGRRILVVDDDAVFRHTVSEVLNAEGFMIEEASGGEQALQRVEHHAPDLILLDTVMEGVDGFETCRRLREHPGSKDVPIIVVTALDDVSAAEQAFQAGATGFATKPISYPGLVQRIRFMLRASENEAELRDHKAMLQTAQRVARLGYWRWDHNSGRFEISENLREMCGITAEECDGTLDAFLRLVCSEDRERVGARLSAATQDHHLGAFDYRISGPGDLQMIVQQDLELIPTTSGLGLLGTVQDVTRQRHSEDQIRKMAYYDALTGLASRSHLMQHLDDIIRVARRREEQFSVLFLDLDGFKDINDSLGHEVGDFMLVSIARRLQQVVRDIDFVARLGGDEFCILLDDSRDELDAAEVATRCLESINQPIEFDHQTWRPHVSIGLARFPEDGETAGMLLKAADSAMYAAKQSGKHRYAFYRPEMTEEAERRLASEQLLREAIEQEQFELHYQPQIDLHTGNIVGVEALARWRHPQRGLVMPGEFIPTLERIGLIRKLGVWVIRAACRQAMAWRDAGLEAIRVAVNISPLHFHDTEILGSVSEALAESGLPPDQLEIEITESSVQSDTRAMVTLRQLQALGVRISIDDFGTGYSSLGSLKHLPINTLKIDRIFVADMLNNNEDALMLGTIIGLAHALGYKVLAEGVEESDQASVLAGLNCDLAQGYYFSRPVGAEAIPALVRAGSFMTGEATDIPVNAVCVGGKDG